MQEKKLEPRAVLIYDFCGFMPDFKALSALCSAEGLLTVEICQNALPKGDCDIALSAVKTPEVCAGLIFTDIKRAAENLIRIEKSDPMGIGAPLLDFELEKATEHLSLVPRKRASRRQKALRLAEKYAEKGLVPAFDFSDKSFGYNGFPFFAENAEHKLSLTELSKARFYSPACAVRGLSTAGGREEFPSAFAAADRLVVFELFQGN